MKSKEIEGLTFVQHLPQEISRFCKYFLEYNDELDATVRSKKFHRNPLLEDDLEIPTNLRVEKGKDKLEIFSKMKGFCA